MSGERGGSVPSPTPREREGSAPATAGSGQRWRNPTRLVVVAGGTLRGARVIELVRKSATAQELLTLFGHQDYVYSLPWSPDGKRLASAGGDRFVQVYAMDIEVLMSLARSWVTRNLTLEEYRKYLHADQASPIPFS